MKRLATVNRIFTDLIDENNQLKHELEIMKLTRTPEEKQTDVLTLSLIELGKNELFKKCTHSFYMGLEYDEDGVNKDFERWFVDCFHKDGVPSNLSVEFTKETIGDIAKAEYEKRKREAQLEYARSKKDA